MKRQQLHLQGVQKLDPRVWYPLWARNYYSKAEACLVLVGWSEKALKETWRRALGGAEATGEWLLNSTQHQRTYQWRINSCQIPRRAKRVSPMSRQQQQLQKISHRSRLIGMT